MNADAQPVSLCPFSTISWQNAVKAYFLDKVRIIESYEDQYIRSANFTMNKPSIVILTNYHRVPQDAKSQGVTCLSLDKFYMPHCFNEFSQQELTIDCPRT